MLFLFWKCFNIFAIACLCSLAIGISLECLWIFIIIHRYIYSEMMWNSPNACKSCNLAKSTASKSDDDFFTFLFLKDPIFISRMCWVDVWMCTCFPSMADFISLKVVWNSPMKSCFPLESQSHTVHYNKNRRKIRSKKRQPKQCGSICMHLYLCLYKY